MNHSIYYSGSISGLGTDSGLHTRRIGTGTSQVFFVQTEIAFVPIEYLMVPTETEVVQKKRSNGTNRSVRLRLQTIVFTYQMQGQN